MHKDRKVLPAGLKGYAVARLKDALQRISPDYKAPSAEGIIKKALGDLGLIATGITEVNRINASPLEKRLLVTDLANDTRGTFALLKPYTIDQRLKAASISREDYRKTVSRTLQALQYLFLRVAAI